MSKREEILIGENFAKNGHNPDMALICNRGTYAIYEKCRDCGIAIYHWSQTGFPKCKKKAKHEQSSENSP